MTITIEEFGKSFELECFKLYFGDNKFMMVMFGLYVISVLFLAVKGSRKEKALFVYPAVFWLLTVFNPLFANRFILMFRVETRYYRYFWMLPVSVLLIYMLVKLLEKCNKSGKICVLAGVILICFLCRSQMMSPSEPPSNLYRINQEVKDAADIVAADKTKDSVKVIYGDLFFYEIRQYDASIRPFITLSEFNAIHGAPLTQELYDQVVADEDYSMLLQYVYYLYAATDDELLRQALDAEEIDYIFLDKNRPDTLQLQLSNIGCVEVGQTENYIVVRCR